MINLSLDDHIQAEQVLIEEGLAEYKQGMDFFSAYLVELNTNLYMVEHIFQFPFDVLFPTSEGSTIFFDQVMRNALHVSVLTITKLATDQNQSMTLRKFKNKVKELVKNEYKQAFQKRLKEAAFNKETEELLERANGLRNHQIAHFDPGFYDQTLEQETLLFAEIKALCDKLNRLLEALSFGTRYGKLPLSYEIGRPDIEDVLIGYAGRSSLLNLPESNPIYWQQMQPKINEEDIKMLNYYRRKLYLNEVWRSRS